VVDHCGHPDHPSARPPAVMLSREGGVVSSLLSRVLCSRSSLPRPSARLAVSFVATPFDFDSSRDSGRDDGLMTTVFLSARCNCRLSYHRRWLRAAGGLGESQPNTWRSSNRASQRKLCNHVYHGVRIASGWSRTRFDRVHRFAAALD